MSDAPNLSSVNLDILLEIVGHDLDAHDLFTLRLTCRSLYLFIQQKTAWIVLLKRLSRIRPLPLPPFRKLASLPLEDLVRMAVKASNLYQNWTSASPAARPAFKMITFSPTDIILSILPIPNTPYLLTLSAGGNGMRVVNWITCVDTERGRKIARYRSEGLVSSWRAETVAEGVIIIALLIGPEDRSTISPEVPAHYNVLRLQLPNDTTCTPASFHGISSHLITSPITGMFLTSEVAGLVSVIRTTQTTGLLMTRFIDGTTAHIDSGLPVIKPNLNTIANQADLILYTEDNSGASAFAYSFVDDLIPLFAPSPPATPQKLVKLAPTTIQSYKFHPQELCDGSNNAYTVIRPRWKDVASQVPLHRAGHSEISVLSMAFVLGADPTGIHDHRCISHMYLDPFHPIDHIEDGCSECCRCSTPSDSTAPSSSASDSGSDDIPMNPPFTPSSALCSHSPSPTVVSSTSFMDEDPKRGDHAPVVRRTFHSCLEEKKEIWRGPSQNDLISVGLDASHAIWLAAGEGGPELRLASFEEPPFPLPLRVAPKAGHPPQSGVVTIDGTELIGATEISSARVGPMPPKAIRTLKLPISIRPSEISAMALDDANGVIVLATTRNELWLLDYAISPSSLRVTEFA